ISPSSPRQRSHARSCRDLGDVADGVSPRAPVRTCVIGAGSSGMVAVKALADAGLDCDCFEETDEVGGLWVFGNGRSSAYSSLSINTSRQRMQYADFAMPSHYPDYPGH